MKAKTAAKIVSIFSICLGALILFYMGGGLVSTTTGFGYENIFYVVLLASGIYTLVMTNKNNNKEKIGMIVQLVLYSFLGLGSLLLIVTIWFLPIGIILLAIIATPFVCSIIYFVSSNIRIKEAPDMLTEKLMSFKKLYDQGLLSTQEYDKIVKTYLDQYYPPKEG